MNLSGLNSSQKEGVVTTDGPLMILAGAGSGKTRTLVTRISYLLEEKQVSPYQLLALTFSNKAAREMRERIAKMVSNDIGALQITTFHAFCAKLLRSEANYLGLSRNFTIYDDSESKAVVKTLLERRGISTKEMSPYDVLDYIDKLKNNGHYVGKQLEGFHPEDQEFYSYFDDYERELHRANAIDFGGLITGVLQLFDKYPEVLERYQKRFHYILVDEYQDTNRAQFELIRLLSHLKRNICVVGDEDQSIYSWRGADIRNILDFEKIFPESKIIKLEQNYRSSKTIIEAATCVISRNVMRRGKQMWTDNHDGEVIEIVECFNDIEEAEFVASEILKISKEGTPLHEFALFYRSNAQSRVIEDALRKNRIAYKVIGGIKFYERKEIKDMLAYLRLVINPKDSLALSRIINVPTRGIGATSLRKLEMEAISNNVSLWEIIQDIVDNPGKYAEVKLSAKIRSSLQEFVTLIQELQLLDQNKISPVKIFDKALHESGYYAHLKATRDYEMMARLENLDELGKAITQFEEINEEATLTGFLETITLDTTHNTDELTADEGEVSLMTVHGAKGLEFAYAFVVGAEENIFPNYKSIESGEMALEEERRLFYVAMTRAMKKLYITFAQGRMLFGQLKFNGPSRFIDEIPNKLFTWKKLKSSQNRFTQAGIRGKNQDFDDYADPVYDDQDEVVYQVKAEIPKIKNSKFPKGVKVVHSLYGQGLVIESEGSGTDEKVVIRFSDGNQKKFMVKFAPLSLL